MENPSYLRNQSSVGGTDMVHVHQVRKNTPNQTENKFEESARERVSGTEKVVLVVD